MGYGISAAFVIIASFIMAMIDIHKKNIKNKKEQKRTCRQIRQQQQLGRKPSSLTPDDPSSSLSDQPVNPNPSLANVVERQNSFTDQDDILPPVSLLSHQRSFIYDDLIDFFTQEEQLYINASDNKNKALCKIWSIKESFVKNTGNGLKFNPKKYSVTITDDNIILKENNDIILNYSFKIFDYGDYIISICISDKDYDFTRLNFFEMSATQFCNLLIT